HLAGLALLLLDHLVQLALRGIEHERHNRPGFRTEPEAAFSEIRQVGAQSLGVSALAHYRIQPHYCIFFCSGMKMLALKRRRFHAAIVVAGGSAAISANGAGCFLRSSSVTVLLR